MKTNTIRTWTAVGVSGLLLATAGQSLASEQAATAARQEKTYTGTVISVNPNEHMLHIKGLILSRNFNLGGSCAYAVLDKPAGAIGDLRPGQKVMVSYQNVKGVLVADTVAQVPMREEGMVKAIDPAAHTLTLRLGMMDKTFRLPADCDVTLRGGKTGAFVDILSGSHVTVTYETPGGKPVAREIEQTSETFTGSLTAIDLEQKTVKAKTTFATKKFNIANDCAIVINGRPDGKLTDLRPGESLMFSYDDVNGVNVVNRIGTGTPAPQNTETTSVQPVPVLPQ